MNVFVGFDPRKPTHWIWSIFVIIMAILTPILALIFTVFMIPVWGFIIDDLMPVDMEAEYRIYMKESSERNRLKKIEHEKRVRIREAEWRKRQYEAHQKALEKRGL